MISIFPLNPSLSLSVAITVIKPTHILQLFHYTVHYEEYLHELSHGCRVLSVSKSLPPHPLFLSLYLCLIAFSLLRDLALALEMSIRRSLVQKSVFRLSFTIESSFPISSCLYIFPLPPLMPLPPTCLIYLSGNQLETPLGTIILAPSIKIAANCNHVFLSCKWKMFPSCLRLIRLPYPLEDSLHILPLVLLYRDLGSTSSSLLNVYEHILSSSRGRAGTESKLRRKLFYFSKAVPQFDVATLPHFLLSYSVAVSPSYFFAFEIRAMHGKQIYWQIGSAQCFSFASKLLLILH